ncbi:hypothetical protein GE061_016937 [Apolygus lucorum]|uniref:Uncharacterized protein n=1 Tax=Apolygus lucorum TaxID=248454 RepID=A0A8S9XJN0_APOLU|nr:hypothetical protein GE061_016937 [Apolygus lucorum]
MKQESAHSPSRSPGSATDSDDSGPKDDSLFGDHSKTVQRHWKNSAHSSVDTGMPDQAASSTGIRLQQSPQTSQPLTTLILNNSSAIITVSVSELYVTSKLLSPSLIPSEGDMELVSHPNWILDRRDSGFLFWRRESAAAAKTVKFRCEVEVLEFWPSEEERALKRYKGEINDEMPPPSALVCAVCLCAMLATVSYTWLFPF